MLDFQLNRVQAQERTCFPAGFSSFCGVRRTTRLTVEHNVCGIFRSLMFLVPYSITNSRNLHCPNQKGQRHAPVGALLYRDTGDSVVRRNVKPGIRSEEHTSELQSQSNLVCRLLLEKKTT